ncbi:sugar phosphate isomerase/epimerase family protein [Microbacterium oleivorans]|uniref:TIM barrel protein n=1 Tax=Microbacterium oleivorans TaxID=273677 RepID=A0A7D5IRR3_9MICO|nr:sugar phosphate isomerase/epimerase [Microbacterium oleivorans]QLD12761.1 TIM barrel protein [Microbacterium oleivorans]
MTLAVAGAPVSFGVFELTPDGAATLSADDMLRTLAENGYTGVDLGPTGFLGDASSVPQKLREYGLELAGGWVDLPLTDDDAFAAALPRLHSALETFSAVAETSPSLLPLPTLADSGSPERVLAPGRGSDVQPTTQEQRDRLARNLDAAVSLVRSAGLEPTFHHHAGTFVESPAEVDLLLDRVDIGLTLDTGHLAVAGGDLATAVERWGARVNHLHLKDVNTELLNRLLRSGAGMLDVWSSGAFVALGEGDLAIPQVLDSLLARGYAGWIVVEQDILPGPDVDLADFFRDRVADHQTSRQALNAWVPTAAH